MYKERTELISNQRRLKNGANIELSSVSKNCLIKQRNASDKMYKKIIQKLKVELLRQKALAQDNDDKNPEMKEIFLKYWK